MTEPASVAGTDAQTKRFAEAADSIRARADSSAKGLAAIGTTAVTTLGVVKFADVFPVRADFWPIAAAVAMFLGLFSMIVAVLRLAARQWRITRPVFTRTQVRLMKDLDDDVEEKIVEEVYQEHALLNGAPTLAAYEARGVRYQRIADRMQASDPRRAWVEARAAVISSEVRAKQARAAALVIRRRATQGVTGWKSVRPVMLFVAGLALTAVAADYLDAERDRPELATQCATAVKGLTEAGLDPADYVEGICQIPEAKDPPDAGPPGVTATRAATLSALADQHADCVEAAKEARAPACDELRRLIQQVAAGPSAD